MLPKIAEGDANKVWVIPSEITKALEGLGSAVHEVAGIPMKSEGVRHRVDYGSTEPAELSGGLDGELSKTNKAVEAAIAEAQHAANPGHNAESDARNDALAAPPSDPEPAESSADEPPPPRAHRMR